MLWVLKRTVSSRQSFEHPKHMFKLMDKKIITILRFFFLLTGPMTDAQYPYLCILRSIYKKNWLDFEMITSRSDEFPRILDYCHLLM